MRITAMDVAACAHGELSGADATAHGIAFDSRTVTPGTAFVAIIGERDGHDFIDDAVVAGAPFVIVGRGRSVKGVTCVEVDDTERAVTLIGHMCRERLRSSAEGRIIAVTGSVGKTSTKDMILAVLRSQWPSAHGAHLSFNNDLGVPVTLVNAPDDCPAVVLEMGMRGHGEISRLCEVGRPDVGVVTAVGDAHGERVGGIEGVAMAKSELVAALPKSGTAVLNADDHRVAAMSGRTGARVVTYGSDAGAHVSFGTVEISSDGCHTVDMSHGGAVRRVTLALPGEHMARNACGAVAAGIAVGVPFEAAVDAMAGVTTAPGRMQWVASPDGTRVLDDSYNANPSSMEAALRTLAATSGTRRVAVLGAMSEISDPGSSHAGIARLAAELEIDLVALETDLYGTSATGVAESVAAVGRRGAGLVVLVKGSRAARTERVVAALLR